LTFIFRYFRLSQMKPNTIILLETEGTAEAVSNLYPFNILHPSFELRCGALRLFEKTQRQFPTSRFLCHTATPDREVHLASFRARFGWETLKSSHVAGDILVLQGNIVPTEEMWRTMEDNIEKLFAAHELEHPILFTSNNAAFAAYIPKEDHPDSLGTAIEIITAFAAPFYQSALRVEIANIKHICYLWDAIALSVEALQQDARFFPPSKNEALSAPGVFAQNAENIRIGAGTTIAPCVVLDARKGVIILGENVEIQPHVSVVGPCFIGDNALIKAGARLYEGTSLGEYSKVNGEIKNTIFQAFGNKQHDGCLGYSFIGEWVNLGAGTDVSDLKNNYSTIRVRFSADKAHEISTGATSLGLLAGDHTKSAINTSFNTGTVSGISANVFDRSPEKYVPSFSWGGLETSPQFEVEKAIALARTVMSRRKREFLPEEEYLFRQEFARLRS
jgi:UDP-N-acetylglucosamine diphosphorylase/glucosamine-1-phosphate N-acetyltransferase